MRLKLPPAIIFLVFGALMFFLARILPVGKFDFFGREVFTKVLLGIAILIAVIAIVQFRLKKTTVNPQRPQKASSLVTTGIYDLSRNPMYLAMLLLLVALGLEFQNAFNTLLVGGYVFYMNKFQIIPEEEELAKKFGQEYKLYLKAVRRWF
ncbi:methyltransferase family protein [Croceivirga thetidis]|uniref:Isoprenylcysteine carboxylmethyltransferase family protein n=1 Tax=Croceivirga thetidis TaxID=2721623 RepID=A0ABX1GUL4_9FLAO|nr:isoprenylcysteine carboxylmethyltransferase family protein [Croceivirga thetidis]NKI32610.1 isoprenylcysteine carboxylmethyltransferase family protein [Croceivirga thetidis]